MAIINLRDYYPFYTSDCFMEVSEEVAEMFKEFDRKEAAYRLRTYRHKAYYSLDRDDGLEHEAVFVALSAPFVPKGFIRRSRFRLVFSDMPALPRPLRQAGAGRRLPRRSCSLLPAQCFQRPRPGQ